MLRICKAKLKGSWDFCAESDYFYDGEFQIVPIARDDPRGRKSKEFAVEKWLAEGTDSGNANREHQLDRLNATLRRPQDQGLEANLAKAPLNP